MNFTKVLTTALFVLICLTSFTTQAIAGPKGRYLGYVTVSKATIKSYVNIYGINTSGYLSVPYGKIRWATIRSSRNLKGQFLEYNSQGAPKRKVSLKGGTEVVEIINAHYSPVVLIKCYKKAAYVPPTPPKPKPALSAWLKLMDCSGYLPGQRFPYPMKVSVKGVLRKASGSKGRTSFSFTRDYNVCCPSGARGCVGANQLENNLKAGTWDITVKFYNDYPRTFRNIQITDTKRPTVVTLNRR